MTKLSDVEPSPRRRRFLGLRTLVRAALSVTALLFVYYLFPADGGASVATLVFLAVGLGLVLLLGAWQLAAIVRSANPTLRAVEALATFVPLFLITFALTYDALSADDVSNFSESLSKVSALYFTITVFSTVGFGDITPRSDTARIIVSVQMIADLGLLGLGLRVLLDAVKLGHERRSTDSEAPLE